MGLALKPRAPHVAEHALRAIARTMRPPRFSGDSPVRFSVVQYQLIITNAGTADAFTAAQTVADDMTVMPDSAARVRQRVLTSPMFVSNVDRRHWQAAGRRPYAPGTDHAGASSTEQVPPGSFSFTPHGHTLTFSLARRLPTTRRALAEELRRLLERAGEPKPAAALSLRQYGFLLGTAPLSRGARRALLAAIGALPGVQVCNSLFPTRSGRDDAFCVNGNPTNTEVLIDPHTGVALVVCERLRRRTLIYPHFPVGALVDSDTFLPLPSASSGRP
jgi:hypothetical protein